MKRLIITTLAATLLAGTALSGTAMAAGQRYDDHGGRYDQRHDDRHDDRYDRRERDRRDGHRADRHDDRRDYRRWQRGQRLDARYRDNRYYVSDYRRHGLRAPPRGYRWQRVDDSYVLAAVATGLIASVIIANH
jgi:Ni/Co efflux regulator RcnB